MNVKVTRPTVKQRILNDKVVSPIIRRLVEEAKQSGYSVRTVESAIRKVWNNENIRTRYSELVATEEEETFFKKVDSFYEDFGRLFVKSFYLDEMISYNAELISRSADTPYGRKIIDSLKAFTKAAYVTYLREDEMKAEYIRSYLILGCDNDRQVLRFIRKLGIGDMYLIKETIDQLIIIANHKPVVSNGSDYNNYSIDNNLQFKSFLNQYPCKRRTQFALASLELIWIIKNFY